MSELTFEINPLRVNPKYSNKDIDPRNVNKYKFVSDFYNGTGGVFDGSYLKSYIRESFYENRQQQCSYRNFIKPIVRSTIDPVFASTISRTTINPIHEDFLENVDNRNTNINQHIDSVLTNTRLHGVCFTVMDNFYDIPLSQQEVLETRRYPYVYIQTADTVYSYTTDDFNRLISISFYEYVKEDDEWIKLVTTWDPIYTTRRWYDQDKVIRETQNPHNLGVLPVIATYLNPNSEILPHPPVYDMTKLAYTIFNKDSEIRDQERAQAFSIFYMQTDTENSNVTVGPRNAIIIPAGDDITITPGYVSPDSNILKTLMENNEKLVNSLYAIAQQNGIHAVKETSGIAETYKFRSTNEQLKKTAKLAKEYEIKLANLFSQYINTEFDYEVSYPVTFDPYYASLSVDQLLKLLEVELSPEVTVEIKKLLVSKVFDSLDKDSLNELLNTVN